jgi:site-specific DNA recombinase
MSKKSVAKHQTTLQASHPDFPQQIALYMRVSTEDQADRGTIEAQRDFLRQFASLYQLPVADEYADDGVTGTLPLGERPEGQRLLQDAEAGRFGSVLVYRLTRLGRSLKALTEAHETLSRYGVTIRSATEPFDTSTPIGTFLFQLLGSLAELDRAQMLEQLSRGRDRVARNGKWTGGLVPYGYTVDGDGCLTPSQRLVDVLGMTEADVVRDLFQRLAAGSSAVGEAGRLNALDVPTTRYYSNGTRHEGGGKWYPSPMARMIANPTYRGEHSLQSRYGAVERRVPPLVEPGLWEQANAQIKRNQRLPKGNATRIYLLRGLITCGQCGSTYVGQVFAHGAYYRCNGHSRAKFPKRQERCRSRVANAAWLECTVWEDCRAFILNPGDALAEAQRQLHDRQRQAAHMDQTRGHYMQALAEKAQERERIMTIFRRGRLTLRDAEAQLDDITKEEAALRQQCSAIDAQKALAEAFEAHLTDASLLLHRLQDRLEEVDRTNDQVTKRQVIEMLVQGIRMDTHEDGTRCATITYRFIPERVAAISTISASGWTAHRHHLDARYNSVILHVFLWNDRPAAMAQRADGQLLPQVALAPYLSRPLAAYQAAPPRLTSS